MPVEMQTFFLAMTPLGELRAAIPVALSVWKMHPLAAWFWSVLGNMAPAIVLLLILEPLFKFCGRHFVFVKKFLDWWFVGVRGRFEKDYQRWGKLALMIFVAIPLPMTGAWSGAVAAYLFGIPKKQASLFILFGVMIAGVIVTIATMGVSVLF
ncbi:MAG: small multi-drug export protein [bacterium]|nr:small multi-drug export protein [bacterium]